MNGKWIKSVLVTENRLFKVDEKCKIEQIGFDTFCKL